jgi:predicted secreted protein
MSEAFWAYGSTLEAGDGATPTEVFTPVAEITKLTPPNLSRDKIEVTHTLSPNGYREYLSAWRDGGEVGYEANWLPVNATQDDSDTGLHASFNDDVIHHWKITVPDIVSIAFSGFVTAHEPDLPLEKQGQLSGKIKVTGKPVITPL